MIHNPQSESSEGLLYAFALDGKGGAAPLDWAGIRAHGRAAGPLWIHLDRKHAAAQAWLREESGLEPLICDALLTEETRPRTQHFEAGALVILRGVNLNPGSEPDEMISVRMWVDGDRVITLRSPRLLAIRDVREDLENGRGPKTPGGVVIGITAHLGARMAPVLANLAEHLDGFEVELIDSSEVTDIRRDLVSLRRQAITLRRYMGPQRDAIGHLSSTPVDWLSDRERARMRELGDRVTRDLEDLEAMRDRAAVVQEEVANRIAEQMNRSMYMLSIITAVFLPLGLLTGLLGINVGGMPGVDSSWAFAVVCLILLGLGAAAFALLRRWRLL